MAQINIKRNNTADVSTPPSGVQALFIGTDGIWYSKDDAGNTSVVANGLTGPAGSSGANGSSGSSGVSGSSGSSGVSGSSGSSGESGTSGTSPSGDASPIALLNSNQLVSASIGATANANPDFSIAIGYNADAKNGYNDTDRGAIAIGKNSKSNGRETLAVGEGSEAVAGARCVAMGPYAKGGESSVAVGNYSAAWYNGYSVSMGDNSSAQGNWSVAIGGYSFTRGHYSMAVGGQSGTLDGAFYYNAIALGGSSKYQADDAIAIGYAAKSTAAAAVAIGSGSTASHSNAVVLGANSASVVANHTHVNSLFIANVPEYSNNSAALADGLVAGQVYRKSDGSLMIVY